MPSSRRRKFSVQEDSGGRATSVLSRTSMMMSRAGGVVSLPSPFNRAKSAGFDLKPNKIVITGMRMPSSSKAISPMEILAERIESSSSVLTVRRRVSTVNKHVTASAFNIDLFNSSSDNTDLAMESTSSKPQVIVHPKRDAKQILRLPHREKSRQHRVRVRSPKRRMIIQDCPRSKATVSTGAIDWLQEMEVSNIHNPPRVEDTETTDYGDRPSEQSLGDMCRICHGGEILSSELGDLVSACNCRGTVGRVHVRCLERWLTESGKSRCELCGARYATRRIHRYGVPRALLMWVLSQNAKQLMVDSLGIMLMSPLAVLAAWLSGRTLAGLMTQEGHATPWPLASTFVLACMTLVCYYCWIVSAATRHALGWWIWYRSQYEVRLQLQNNENA